MTSAEALAIFRGFAAANSLLSDADEE